MSGKQPLSHKRARDCSTIAGKPGFVAILTAVRYSGRNMSTTQEPHSERDLFTTYVDWQTGILSGSGVQQSIKHIGEMAGVFQDAASWAKLDPATPVYRVQYWKPVADGTSGGLFWGNSEILPGKVGNEYFMTKGHLHAQIDRAEYYATVCGEGFLLLMDLQRKTICLEMAPGRVHYIPGATVHRVVNTGKTPLRFLACWGSD